GEMIREGKGSIHHVLTASSRRAPTLAMSAAYRDIRDRLNDGHLLHVALAPYFTPMENMLIESVNMNAKSDAERGQGFITAAGVIARMQGIRAGVLQVLASLVFSILTVAFMGLGVAPFTAAQFEQITPRKYWPELSRI